MPAAITRCGNFYGGGDLNWNRIVPGTIRSLYRNSAPVIRSDGKFIRDYIHVDDGAGAYMLLAERLAESRELAGRAFNFSTEERFNVLDLVQRIADVMGSDLAPVVMGEARAEIIEQSLDASRARTELGWRPMLSLEQGLARTVDWYKSFFAKKDEARVPERPVRPSSPPPGLVRRSGAERPSHPP